MLFLRGTPTVDCYLNCHPELGLGHSFWLQVPSSWSFTAPQNAGTSQIRKWHRGSRTQSDCNPGREGNEKDICIIETFQDGGWWWWGGEGWGNLLKNPTCSSLPTALLPTCLPWLSPKPLRSPIDPGSE